MAPGHDERHLVDYLEGNPCGRASVGWWPAWIRLATRHECINRGFFPDLVGHELGHVLGFRHVSDSNMVMAAGGRPHQMFRFSPPELYHAASPTEWAAACGYCGGWPVDGC